MSGKIIPFLKWAGGKRWLTQNHAGLLPTKFSRYIEPFLGSGALFFHLQPKLSILSDINIELIETYLAIKNDYRKVEEALRLHHSNHSKDYYYKIRSSSPQKPHTKAAKFIYLNRTCWNGLYRVNKNGEFNVPIGTKNNVILETDNFESTSSCLQRTIINACDFEETIDQAKRDDFIFIDPPYTIKHNYNGFIKYNQQLFSWDDQIRLRDCIVRAVDRGSKIVLLNANHNSICELYREFENKTVLQRSSVLAASSLHRGKYEELAITHW